MSGVITSVTFDKPGYQPGDTITATVQGSWAVTETATFTLGDGTTGNGTFNLVLSVNGKDTGNHAWVVQSNNGSTAVLTAQA
jgi:uncharacterized protein YfaS (alpha-2-macroglobulin family)